MREIILIEFFDTVMFREVHSFQLLSQWAKIISGKYGLNQDLLGIRKKLENEFKDNIYEIPYKELIKNIKESIIIAVIKIIIDGKSSFFTLNFVFIFAYLSFKLILFIIL